MDKAILTAIDIISCAIKKENISDSIKPLLTEETLKKIYKFSKFQDEAGIVGYALNEQNLITGEIKEAFNKEVMLSVMRVEKNLYALTKIKEYLQAEKIDFIPLKGSVIRELYPYPFFRMSADVDILLRKENFENSVEIISTKYNLPIIGRSSHDCAVEFPNGTHVEFHFYAVDSNAVKGANKIMQTMWENAEVKEGTEYKFTNEFLYLYHLVHTAKHVETGGCGIKPIIDFYLLKNLNLNAEKLNELIKTANLEKFNKELEKLIRYFFNDERNDSFTEEVAQFVCLSGVYGSLRNFVAFNQVKTGSKKSYILKRIFMPYDLLKKQYPRLEKRKWLFPYYQCVRWCKMIFSGRLKRSVSEVKYNTSLSDNNNEKAKDLLKNLGLL